MTLPRIPLPTVGLVRERLEPEIGERRSAPEGEAWSLSPRSILARDKPFPGGRSTVAATIVDKAVHCNCGFDAPAASEPELVAEVRRHEWEEYGMELSRDEALVLAFRGELAAASTTHRDDSSLEKEKR